MFKCHHFCPGIGELELHKMRDIRTADRVKTVFHSLVYFSGSPSDAAGLNDIAAEFVEENEILELGFGLRGGSPSGIPMQRGSAKPSPDEAELWSLIES